MRGLSSEIGEPLSHVWRHICKIKHAPEDNTALFNSKENLFYLFFLMNAPRISTLLPIVQKSFRNSHLRKFKFSRKKKVYKGLRAVGIQLVIHMLVRSNLVPTSTHSVFNLEWVKLKHCSLPGNSNPKFIYQLMWNRKLILEQTRPRLKQN